MKLGLGNRKDGFWSVVNDPKGGSDVLLKLTEKRRMKSMASSMGKEKRELKRYLKEMDLQLKEG